MKRSSLFVIISSIALIAVIVFQVLWLIQIADSKEKFFNEKSDIIRSRTTEAITADTSLSNKLETGWHVTEAAKIDSLIQHYMKFYNFREKYVFEVVTSDHMSMTIADAGKPYYLDQSDSQIPCGVIQLNQLESKNPWKLLITFPEKEQFILSEMGIPFLSSVALVLIVMVLFWRTIATLLKEKSIYRHSIEFLNNMTHEFKTPLTNIALAGKMIAKDSVEQQNSKVRDYSGIILTENEKLRLQVEQVLSMAALERGEIPVHKTEVDFHQLIHDALRSMRIQIESRQGNLMLILDASQFVIMGDKTHLTNAVCNLIDNAIKYSGGQPQISVKTYNKDSHLVIEITDTGMGIEKQFHKKVFGKFFRIPKGNVHDVRGFGMGLAYVKMIAELHGGSVGLESIVDQGTTFTINLPYEE